jgi:Tol biopolymer transport system component
MASTSPSSAATCTPPTTRTAAADVFDLHLPTGTIERISLGTGGVQIVGGHCTRPSISADGRFVAFQTNAVVDPADTNVWQDVYVHDRATQVTQLASISMTGAGSNNTCTDPRISGDGRYVVFMTRATTWSPGRPARACAPTGGTSRPGRPRSWAWPATARKATPTS